MIGYVVVAVGGMFIGAGFALLGLGFLAILYEVGE